MSEKLDDLIINLHNEIRSAIDKNYQPQWTIQKDHVFRQIALLLLDNPSENQVQAMIEKLKKNTHNDTSKKGRPKKKDNPWKHIIEDCS